MKWLLLVFGLIFMGGCEIKPYYNAPISQEQPEPNDNNFNLFMQRGDDLIRQKAWMDNEEKLLIKAMSDEQLPVYQAAKQAFSAHDQVAKEIAHRNLLRVFDANSCSTLITVLEEREQLQIKTEEWINDAKQIQENNARFEKWLHEREQSDRLERDLMIIDSDLSLRSIQY